MAQRYGRNQKRRAREQIAKLQADLGASREETAEKNRQWQNAVASLQIARRELAVANGVLSEAIRILGANSVMLPPRRIRGVYREHEGDFLMHDSSSLGPSRQMRALLVDVQSDKNLLTKARRTHGHVRMCDRELTYVVEQAALESCDAQTLAEVIADEIRREMVPLIQREARGV